MEIFLVGGAVRDKLMGKEPKDFDYTVVLPPGSYADPYQFMVDELDAQGFQIWRDKQFNPIGYEHFTVRAQFPKQSGNRKSADFVLARQEGPYSDGRHPDWVRPGTLMDDLTRRDFTMNAIAEDMEGNLFDPFNGRTDIDNGVIRVVGDTKTKMLEDALRVLRALRFRLQLGFGFDTNLRMAMFDREIVQALRDNIKDERKMDELNKMFRMSTLATLRVLQMYVPIRDAVFSGSVNIEATMKQKGFQ
jgi:tRNA nucleotidyltransferase (CCA-adding enzyme)